MKAYTDKSNIIEAIDDLIGGNRRPILFASSSSRRQHLPTPPRHKLRGSIGSSYFGCARNDLRSKDRSRRTVQSSQYEPNGSARVGEGRSVVRGRVLSQSLLVARERRRRELGSNLVIVTTSVTTGEGHVVEDGISRRVRKICAGVPASVVIRDQILTLSFSRSKRQYWTVGNRPIRKNDLRSLHRNSVEAQIQDRSRQKTGLNTAPGFSRVYPSFPRTNRSEGDACAAPREKQSTRDRAERRGRVRSTQGMPENHQHRPFEAPNTKTTHLIIPPSHSRNLSHHSSANPQHPFPRGNRPLSQSEQSLPSPSQGETKRRGLVTVSEGGIRGALASPLWPPRFGMRTLQQRTTTPIIRSTTPHHSHHSKSFASPLQTLIPLIVREFH